MPSYVQSIIRMLVQIDLPALASTLAMYCNYFEYFSLLESTEVNASQFVHPFRVGPLALSQNNARATRTALSILLDTALQSATETKAVEHNMVLPCE